MKPVIVANYNYTRISQHIPAFDRSNVRNNFNKYMFSGLISRYSFDRPKTRFKMLGMSGRAYQNGFTVACGLTHRRAWQTFLNSKNEYALILEEDAICDSKAMNMKHIIDLFKKKIDLNWHFIQLGRCWDFCESQRIIYTYKKTKFIQSDSPCCSHAYIVSRAGANILLHYSLPHLTSIDLLITLLSRKNILNLYSISPLICNQTRNKNSHDETKLLECDPNEKTLKKNLAYRDDFTFSLIKSHWVHAYTGYTSYKKQQSCSASEFPSRFCVFLSVFASLFSFLFELVFLDAFLTGLTSLISFLFGLVSLCAFLSGFASIFLCLFGLASF